MKKLLLALALLACGPAAAQWQVPVNTVPVGRGPGVSGFNSVANTGTGTLCLLNTAPPTFGSCGSGGTPGGSNTQLQYNNAGSFGGITGATTDGTTVTLVAPILGNATATTINKVSIPAPATAATISMSNNKTLTINNSLQLAGVDSTTITFQGTDTYVGRTTTDTMSNKTFVAPVLGDATATTINKISFPAPATAATISMSNNKTLTVNNSLQLAGVDSTTITFQGTDTYIGRTTTDTLTNKTFDTAGAGNSFSINGVAATANTGTGAVVRAVSPSFTTPILGVATATTLNKVTINAPATTATINMSDNKTLTINNTLQFAGTDSTTQTFPSTSATIARTDAAQTFTGVQTFGAGTSGAPALNVGAAGTGMYSVSTTGFGFAANALSIFDFGITNSAKLFFGAAATMGGDVTMNAQNFMPSITTTSAAQTGTVCWTTGTGKFTADTTVGCLTSIMSAKNITEQLIPAKALDIVSRLNPFAFRYKAGWGDSGRYEQFGLGAEQVALIDERLVGRDPEGTLQGVRYQELTAVLAGAIKELKADNDNLRSCQNNWKCRIFGVK